MRLWLFVLLILEATIACGAPLTVTGNVVDANGRPLGGCTVLGTGTDLVGKLVTTTTDGNGSFSITYSDVTPVTRCQVAAMYGELPVAWANVKRGSPVTLILSGTAVACGGLVTTFDGVPVPNVRVYVSQIIQAQDLHWSRYEQTLYLGEGSPCAVTADAQGRFSIGAMPQNARIAVAATAPGYASAVQTQTLAQANDVRLYLQPEASISGRVVYQGQPVAGVVVSGAGAYPVKSGGDGAFHIAGLSPGEQRLYVRPTSGGLVGAKRITLNLDPGQQMQGVMIELQRAATVTGKCVDARTRAPFAGALIWGRCPTPTGGDAEEAVSAPDGTFSVNCPPGDLEIICNGNWSTPPYYFVSNEIQRFHVQPGEKVQADDIVVEVWPSVKGQVLLPDGGVAAGVEIGTVARIDYGVVPTDFFCTKSDEKGGFSLQVLRRAGSGPPFCILAQDRVRNLAGMIYVSDTQKPATISLQPGGWLLSRAVTPTGAQVPGWPVELKVNNPGVRACAMPGGCSADDGSLRIGPLPAGIAFNIRVAEPAGNLLVNRQLFEDIPFALKPGEEQQIDPLIVEPRGRKLRGWVGDAQGRPLAGAVVVAEQAPYLTRTDSRGQFELSGLPLRGKVRVVAMHATQGLFAGTNVEPDGTVEPGLVPVPPLTLILHVKKPDGTPLSTAQTGESGLTGLGLLSNELSNRLYPYGSGVYGFSDENGVVTMHGLVAGLSYQVWVTDRFGKFASKTVGFYATPGQDVDMDVTLDAR